MGAVAGAPCVSLRLFNLGLRTAVPQETARKGVPNTAESRREKQTEIAPIIRSTGRGVGRRQTICTGEGTQVTRSFEGNSSCPLHLCLCL